MPDPRRFTNGPEFEGFVLFLVISASGVAAATLRDPIVVLRGIRGHHHADLPEVRHRLCRLCGEHTRLRDREGNGRQYRDNGNDDQWLDKRESESRSGAQFSQTRRLFGGEFQDR